MPSSGACPSGYTCLESEDFGLFPETGYRIDLNLETLNPNSAPAYSNALFRWENIIVGDKGAVSTAGAPDYDNCARPLPAVIDDIYICGRDEVIDGPGQILGMAGPDYFRTSDGTTITGRMIFDTADVQSLINSGQFEIVILHEMGVSLFATLFFSCQHILTDLCVVMI